MSESDVEQLLGKPRLRTTNWENDTMLLYRGLSLGFGKSGLLVHIGFGLPSQVFIGDVDLFGADNLRRAADLDGSPMRNHVGFFVMPNLGIAFAGFGDIEDDKAVIAFAEELKDEFLVDCFQIELSEL